MNQPQRQRLYYLDNLRVFLTFLVIAHHTAIAYGAAGGWYFQEVDTSNITISVVLFTLFTAVNQSFFMGLFFFLSGYFTPNSYDRKGPAKFLTDRLTRLGIPLILFYFTLGPLTSYMAGHGGTRTFAQYYSDEVISFRTPQFGPLWFVEALLIFAAAYALWRKFTPSKPSPRPFPTQRTIAITVIGLGAAAFATRLIFPTGTAVLGMQLGYFPSYILLFIAGIAAQRGNWLNSIPAATTRTWQRIALIAIPVLPISLILTGGLEGNIQFEGGLNAQAFVYAMWEPFTAIGIIFFLLKWFANRYNTATPTQKRMSDGAYTAYIIHPFIVVGISVFFVGVPIAPWIKFFIVTALSIIGCFIAAAIIRKIPKADRIL